MTLSATADLLDVNVWLALAVEGHPQHKAALKAWNHVTRPTFCRLTHLGFLRLLCNEQVMGGAVLAPASAWAAYEQLADGGVVEFIAEPAGLEERLKQFARGAKAARDFWTDAYLAAFARCAGLRFVTFDSGFARYKDLDCLVIPARSVDE
jgi:toxin-antitoxin system PIN domain toxin